MIRLVKVTKVYGRETPAIRSSPKEVKGVVALRGVNLHVPRGEFCVLLGRSGSGKSTLLNLIGGLDTPTSGEVYVDGQNLAHLSEVQLTQLRRDKIGFIFQFFNLLPLLTVRENVALPALLRGETWQEVASRVEELLERVGLRERAQHRAEELSGGEMQRVAIARAFINRPAVILADEPTGNLDTEAANCVLESLRTAAQEFGTTVVLVTHSREAAAFGERVLELRDGRIYAGYLESGASAPLD